MTTASISRSEAIVPKLLLRDQIIFALMVWAGFTIFVFALTFVVSLVRSIDVSGWNLAGQPARWFGFAVGIYVGWTLLPLYIAHGGTRHGFARRTLVFTGIYGVVLGLLFTLTFPLEAGLYAVMGWPHVLHEAQLYASPLDLPAVAVQWIAIMTLWVAGGVMIGAAWYRNPAFGAMGIPIALFFAGLSTMATGGDSGPHLWVYQQLLGGDRPGPALAIGLHAASIAILLWLAWRAIKDVPLRNRSR